MFRSGTFGRKIALGYAVAVLCIVVVGAAAIYNLDQISAANELAQSYWQDMTDIEELHAAELLQATGFRGFLLTGDDRMGAEMQSGEAQFRKTFESLSPRILTPEGKQFLKQTEQAHAAFTAALDQVVEARRRGTVGDPLVKMFETDVWPKRLHGERILIAFLEHERQLVADARAAATRAESQSLWIVVAVAFTAMLVAVLLTVLLTRSLVGTIGPAVRHVQVSATQLQSTANQQASGSKQNATVMSEILTTMKELLTTSRQIAENSQRVAVAAADASTAAGNGDQVVGKAQSAVDGIKALFDQIVQHMLVLGKKSQQIGGILEIVNELAEQTNILAINATIEAAGAGEPGKRFGAVADEVRKLSDRVSGSTKEIRDLIDEMRAAVNSTVMSTESGAKLVETGTHDVGEVVTTLSHIAQLAGAVTEAAREIELNTKQQSGAVNQVSTALGEVTAAAKQLEASTDQTLQTSSLLSNLSHDVALLIGLGVATG